MTGRSWEAFLDEFISRQLAEQNIPGATLSVVQDGEVLLVRGYGYADLEAQTPVDGEQSLFRIGSVAKLITWTAVMQLVEQGRLDLDADVNDYLDFTIPARLHGGRGEEPAPVTMRHLLTHTPGFEDVGEGLFVLSPGELTPLGEHLQAYMPARIYPAGEVLAYSNYGSALAGYIVAQVSGQPFAAYVEEHIFEPLGMRRSTFRQPLPGALAPHLVGAYKYVDGQFHRGDFEYIPMYPAGSMSSTAADMARFMLAQLQGGHYEAGRILQEETVREMHRQQFTYHPQMPGITLGFIEMELNGEKIIHHNGATMLFFNHLFLLPEHNLGFFISYSGGDIMQAMDLFQAFMDRYYPPPPGEAPPVPPAGARERALEYLGEYHPTRISLTSAEKLFGLLQAMQLGVDEAGYLVLNLQGEPLQFVEVEPGFYQNVNPREMPFLPALAFETGPHGQPLAAGGAATYSRAPWYGTLTFNGGLLAAALLLISCTLAVWLLAFLWRLLRGEKRRAPRDLPLARGLVVVYSLLAIVFVLGLVFLFTDINPAYGVPNVVFGIVPFALQVVLALPWALAVFTPLLVLCAVLAWTNRAWSLAGRLHYSLFTAGAVGLMWVLFYLNMI